MSARRFLLNASMVLIAASLAAGCRSTKKGDTLGTEPIEGDQPLSTTTDDIGERVTGVTFDAIYFNYDSAQIGDEERGKIETVADYLKENTSYRVLVEGHCDERGTTEYNIALGERRALAVRAYLIGLEINADDIITRSLGEEQPVDAGHEESAWSQNRRAEFGIYKK